MDDELERQLHALRQSDAAKDVSDAQQSREGNARLAQFVEEMKRRQIPPFPIVKQVWKTRVIKGTPSKTFKKGTPDRRVEVAGWELVAYGWTVGHPTYHDWGPAGTYDGEAVTEAAVLLNTMWNTSDANSAPTPFVISHGAEKFLLTSSSAVQDAASAGAKFTPQKVAELLHHYIDGAPASGI